MPSRKMRTAIYFFYGLDVEIRPKWTLQSCLSTLVGQKDAITELKASDEKMSAKLGMTEGQNANSEQAAEQL